nr:MAG TPA: hypothetical protein [Caudoviricetes sp.]
MIRFWFSKIILNRSFRWYLWFKFKYNTDWTVKAIN